MKLIQEKLLPKSSGKALEPARKYESTETVKKTFQIKAQVTTIANTFIIDCDVSMVSSKYSLQTRIDIS